MISGDLSQTFILGYTYCGPNKSDCFLVSVTLRAEKSCQVYRNCHWKNVVCRTFVENLRNPPGNRGDSIALEFLMTRPLIGIHDDIILLRFLTLNF